MIQVRIFFASHFFLSSEIFSYSLLNLAGVCTVSLKIKESRDEGLIETFHLTETFHNMVSIKQFNEQKIVRFTIVKLVLSIQVWCDLN